MLFNDVGVGCRSTTFLIAIWVTNSGVNVSLGRALCRNVLTMDVGHRLRFTYTMGLPTRRGFQDTIVVGITGLRRVSAYNGCYLTTTIGPFTLFVPCGLCHRYNCITFNFTMGNGNLVLFVAIGVVLCRDQAILAPCKVFGYVTHTNDFFGCLYGMLGITDWGQE